MGRQYRHKEQGYRIPAVTTIIPDGYEGVPEDNLQEAKERGTFVHKASVLMDQDNLDWNSVPPAWQGYLHGWARAVEYMQIKHLTGWIERPSLSKILGFAGTPDRVSTIALRLTPTIIDIKTGETASTKLKALWALQAAGYEILYREVTGHKGRVDRLVIQVHRGGKYTPYPFDDPSDLAAFRNFCATLKWKMAKGLA